MRVFLSERADAVALGQPSPVMPSSIYDELKNGVDYSESFLAHGVNADGIGCLVIRFLDFQIGYPPLEGLFLIWLRPEKSDSHTHPLLSVDNRAPRLERLVVLQDEDFDHSGSR